MAQDLCSVKEEPSDQDLFPPHITFPSLAKAHPAVGREGGCGLDTFLKEEEDSSNHARGYGGQGSGQQPNGELKNRGGDHGSPPSFQPPPSYSPKLPLSQPYTKDEIRTLLHYGRCRLVKINSRSRIWQHFERVINELGQDTTYVACVSCRALLTHRLTSGTSTLITHLERCRPGIHDSASPESPTSRSSDSASPQFHKDDILSQPHLLFSQQLLQQEQLQQQKQQQPVLHPQYPPHLNASPPFQHPLDPSEQFNILNSLRTAAQSSFLGLHPLRSPGLLPSFGPPAASASGSSTGLRSPQPHNNFAGKRKRSHRYELEMLRKRPSQDIHTALSQGNSGASRSPGYSGHNQLPPNSGDRTRENKNEKVPVAKASRQSQQAVLDAAVAFCCLDGRWFDAMAGMGLRELAQAFINIGAQFGTMPAEQLLPQPAGVARRSEEMARLKRRHVAETLLSAVKMRGGSLEVAVLPHTAPQGRLVSCRLCVPQGSALKKGLLGVWAAQNKRQLQAGLKGVMEQFGLDDLKEHLVLVHDGNPLAASDGSRMSGPLVTSSTGDGTQTSNQGMDSPITCASAMIQRTILLILNSPDLCLRLRRTLRNNTFLLRTLARLQSSGCWVHLAPLDLEEHHKVSSEVTLSQVKFTLRNRKRIEELLVAVPRRALVNICNDLVKDDEGSITSKNCGTKFGDEKQLIDYTFSEISFATWLTNTLTKINSLHELSLTQDSSSTPSEPRNYQFENTYEIDMDLLGTATDYFEPFEAALADLSCGSISEPSLGKFVPWAQTLRQYAADSASTAEPRDPDEADALKSAQGYPENVNILSNHDTDTKKQDCDQEPDAEPDCNILSRVEDVKIGGNKLKSKNCSLRRLGRTVVWDELKPHPAHYVATFLTPHFKNLAMLDEREKHRTYERVKILCSKKMFIGSTFFNYEETERPKSNKHNKTKVKSEWVNDGSMSVQNEVGGGSSDPNASTKASGGKLYQLSSNEKIDQRNGNEQVSESGTEVVDKNPTLKALLENDLCIGREKDVSSHVSGSEVGKTESLLEDNCEHSLETNNHVDSQEIDKKTSEIELGSNLSETAVSGLTKKTKLENDLNDENTSTESVLGHFATNATRDTTPEDWSGAVEHQQSVAEVAASYERDAPSTASNASRDSGSDCNYTSEGSVADGDVRRRRNARFTSIAHFMQSDGCDQKTADHPIDLELYRYKSLAFPPASANLVEWWQHHQPQLPLLAALAFKLLAVPVSVQPTLPNGWNLERLRWWTGVAAKETQTKETVRRSDDVSNVTVEGINNLLFLASEW